MWLLDEMEEGYWFATACAPLTTAGIAAGRQRVIFLLSLNTVYLYRIGTQKRNYVSIHIE